MPPAATSSRQSLLKQTNTLSAAHPIHHGSSSYLTSDEVKPHSTFSSHASPQILIPTGYSSSKIIERSTLPSEAAKNTMIIFDWDDTLLPSSFLSARRCRLDSDLKIIPYGAQIQRELEQLDQAVSSLLHSAAQYGKVHIITNAESGWVQLSAAKFLPLTSSMLPSIFIESARSTHEPSFPDAPMKWKMGSFG